jgi:hypothetical protein
MQTWYECKVKYKKIDQTGHERNVNDNYLLDAVSFTDAEARIYYYMQQIVRGDFQVVNIKKSAITEIIPSENGEWWYKAKISMITIDEEAGKEKKTNSYVLVMADDIVEALKRLEQGLSYLLIPYVTTAIQLSNIADVFPYNEEEKIVLNQKNESLPIIEPIKASTDFEPDDLQDEMSGEEIETFENDQSDEDNE